MSGNEGNDEGDRGFKVRDRRWWAQEDDPDSNGANASAEVERKPTYIAELEAKLKDSEAGLVAIRQQYRLAADELEQAKSRITKEAQTHLEQRKKKLLVTFLDVADNLDRAIASAKGGATEDTIIQGVELVHNTMLSTLSEHGVTRRDAQGERFDPQMHEAIAQQPTDDPKQDAHVVQVVQAGYMIGDETLRPARVVVGKLT